MREVILLSSQAKILLSQGDKTQIRAFLKNVGSNFMLNSKRLEISPKNGWRARIEGEPMTSFPNWRRGGDSNSRDLAVCRFSRAVLSTTQTPLQYQNKLIKLILQPLFLIFIQIFPLAIRQST